MAVTVAMAPGTTQPTDASLRTQIRSADRVRDLIQLLATAPEGLGVSEVAAWRALPKASLHELLSVLGDRGSVRRQPHWHMMHQISARCSSLVVRSENVLSRSVSEPFRS